MPKPWERSDGVDQICVSIRKEKREDFIRANEVLDIVFPFSSRSSQIVHGFVLFAKDIAAKNGIPWEVE